MGDLGHRKEEMVVRPEEWHKRLLFITREKVGEVMAQLAIEEIDIGRHRHLSEAGFWANARI